MDNIIILLDLIIIRDLSQMIINITFSYFITWQVFDGIIVIVSFSLDVAFRFVVKNVFKL